MSGLFKFIIMRFSVNHQWLIVVLCFLLFSCAGAKKVIQTAEAFVLTPQQGTVRVDEKGNEVSPTPTPVIIVFVHCRSNKVNWDSAWLGNKAYAVVQQLITKPIEMGADSNTGEKITISPQEGAYLFQLQITPQFIKGEERVNSIRVRASYQNKTIYREVSPVRSIQTPDAQ
jgi:hypothetical protein